MRTEVGPKCFSCVEAGNRQNQRPQQSFASAERSNRNPFRDPLPPRPKQGLFDAFEEAKNRVTVEQWNKINASPRTAGYVDKVNDPRDTPEFPRLTRWGYTKEKSKRVRNSQPTSRSNISTATIDTDLWQVPPGTILLSDSPEADGTVDLVADAPTVPGKTPQVPQKPLAYRHSLDVLSDAVAHQTISSGGFRSTRDLRPLKRSGTVAETTAEKRHYFENLPTAARVNGLRRVQSMRAPLAAQTTESAWSRPEKVANASDITIRIAAVAATYVNSIPQNRGKNINGDEIRLVLEANPTLGDLCRMLRAMNVVLTEQDLKEALVKAIPDINLVELAKPMTNNSPPTHRQSLDLGRRHTMTTPSRYRAKRPQSFIEQAGARLMMMPFSSPTKNSESGVKQGSRMSYPGLTGTHEWVERRLTRLMSDEFLKR